MADEQLTPGNVDLRAQPRVKNPDGSTSTVDSIGVGLDDKQYLLPTVTPDGRHFVGTEEERAQQAINEFRRTGKHLGIFSDVLSSNQYAEQLHTDYAAGKYDPPPVGTTAPSSPAFGLSSDPLAQDRLKETIGRAPSTPPAQAARILNLQLKTGLPAEVIERNLDEIEKQAARQDFDPVKFRRESPALASWLEKRPLNAPAAQDDLAPLTSTERALQIVTHSARTAAAALYKGADLGAWSGLELVGDLLIKVNPGSPVGYWLREKGQQANAQAESRGVGIRGPAPQDPGMIERNIYGAAESIGQSGPIIASSVLLGGGPAVERLSLGLMGAQTGLPAYSQARAAGKGVVESMAFGGAQGAVEAWTEALPLHTLLGNIGARKGILASTIKQMLPEVAGEEIATALQDLDEWATLHPDRPFSDYIKDRPQAFVDTALATILATGAQTGALHGLARVMGGLTTGPTLEHLGEQVKQTGLATSSPGTYEDFIRHVTTDSAEEVHAPLESWDTYWQGKGVDPVAKAAEVTGSPAAYAQAQAEGRDLAIPTARYLTQIANTEHNTFFKDEIRFGIDSLNTREAKAALDDIKHAEPPAGDERNLQREQLVQRLTEGGQFTPAQAEKQARLVESVVEHLAQREGADPHAAAQELLDRMGITRPEAPPAVAGETTELGQPDLTLDERKRIAVEGTPKEFRGQALKAYEMRLDAQAQKARGVKQPSAVFLGFGPDGPLYNVVGGPFDRSTKSAKGLQDLGIAIPETPADTGERLTGAQLREAALKSRGEQAPAPAPGSFEERLAAFGGSGHPESSDYVGKVLSAAGPGTPGLSVEAVAGTSTADLNAQRIVYRGKDGTPIAVAKVVHDSAGNALVQDLAADKSKGLLTGRAMQAIGKRLISIGATAPAGTISRDAQNFVNRLAAEQPSTFFQTAPTAAEMFYSRIRRAVEESKNKAATGQQWKATVKNAKAGINADEFALTRVADLEDGKRYTQQEVLDYLAANEIKLEDVTLGEEGADEQSEEDYQEQLDELTDEIENEMIEEEIKDTLDNMENDITPVEVRPEPLLDEHDEETGEIVYVLYDENGDRIGEEDDYHETAGEAQRVADRMDEERIQSEREESYDWARDRAIENVDRDDAREQAQRRLERQGIRRPDDEVRTRYGQYVEPGGEKGSYREVFLTLPMDRVGGRFTFTPSHLEIKRRLISTTKGEVTLTYRTNDNQTHHLGTFEDKPVLGYAVRLLDAHGEPLRTAGEEPHDTGREIPADWYDRGNRGEATPNPVTALERANRKATELQQGIDSQGLEDRTVEVRSEYRMLGDDHWQEVGEAVLRKTLADPRKLAPEGWVDGHDEYEGIENPIVRLRLNTRHDRASGLPILFLEEVQTPHADEFAKMPELLRKNWRTLAFKWALRYAVDHDLAAVAWTTGDQQAKRYNLAAVVTSIAWSQNRSSESSFDKGARRFVSVETTRGDNIKLYVDPNGKIIEGAPSHRTEDLVGRNLSEAIGEDVSTRILSELEGTITGNELGKIGGEGLRRLYDVDFINVVNGLPAVKRNGGRVSEVHVDVPNEKGTREWVGPDLNASQVRNIMHDKFGEFAEGEAYDNRVRRQQLDNISRGMERGQTLAIALENYGGMSAATDLGGELRLKGPEASRQPAVVITDKMRESILGGQPLFQEGQTPERRGFIQFGPGDRINIGLLPSADLSTFLHETGHLFFKLLDESATRLAALDPATLTESQAGIIRDRDAALKWAGVEKGGAITTAAHEKLAEGFIDYLHEGRAPSLELQSFFQTFRAWLTAVYQSLKRLNVQLTPEVRGVFDRLLASDAAIAEAERTRGYVQMFATAEDMGVTSAEFALYEKATARERATAVGNLDARLMQEVERERTAIWTAQRMAIRDQVKSELQAMPVYRALAAMQYGTQANGEAIPGLKEDGPLRLSKDQLIASYGAERVRELGRIRPYVYQVEGGLGPEYVAELTGFSSGDEMLRAVTQAPAMRVAIENETNARMLRENGSIQLDGSLQAVAQAETANLVHDEVLRLELKALNNLRKTVSPFVQLQKAISEGAAAEEIDRLTAQVRKLKESTRGGAATIRAGLPSEQAVRGLARDRIGALPIRRINAQAFWSTARRASLASTEKAARQDFDGAILAKQQEILNLAMYREAQKTQEDVATRIDFVKRLDSQASRKRIGLAGASYQDQIDGILDRFEFAKVSQRALDRRAALSKWAAGVEAQGYTVDLPEGVLDEARRKNYQDMSVDEFMGVTDGLYHIEHLASLKNQLLTAKDQREFSAERDQVSSNILAVNPQRPTKLEDKPSDKKWRKFGDYVASHRKIALIAQALDNYVDGGPFWSAFMQPINAAADAKEARARVEGTAYAAIVETHYPGRALWDLHTPRFVPALNDSVSKNLAIAVAMNWGNEHGRERVLNDPTRKFDDAQVVAILDLLDRNDWNFVQAHWDYLDHFWPEIAAKMQRTTGVEPEKVAPLPVYTKYGAFRGGYHPLVYDSTRSATAQGFAQAEAGKALTAGAYVRTTTRRGFTKTRQEHTGLPLKLDMGVAFAHIDQVVHDLTHHEMLIDVNRLLRDPKVSKAIYATAGDQIYEQLKNSLEDIAKGNLSPPGKPTPMDQGATWLRQRTQIASMAFNMWTAIQQPIGVFNGMDRVGVTWVAKGAKRWLRDAVAMESTTQWIAEKSPMMAGRVTTATQDLHDLRAAYQETGGWFDRLVRTVSSDHLTQAALTDSFLWHISVAQRVADVPTWLGQYEKSLAAGESEDRAIAIADQAVLDSQGGGQIKDLAKVQRGGPIARAFMTFASYGVTVFNAAYRNVDIARRSGLKDPATILKLLGHMGLLYAMPALFTIALKHASGRGGADDDPLNWFQQVAGEMASSALSGLVYMREAAGAAQIALGLDTTARGYSGPAVFRPVQVAYDVATQVKQGEADKGLWHAVNQGAGYLFAYPATQVQKTVDGAIALYEGRTANPAALIFGPPPKE